MNDLVKVERATDNFTDITIRYKIDIHKITNKPIDSSMGETVCACGHVYKGKFSGRCVAKALNYEIKQNDKNTFWHRISDNYHRYMDSSYEKLEGFYVGLKWFDKYGNKFELVSIQEVECPYYIHDASIGNKQEYFKEVHNAWTLAHDYCTQLTYLNLVQYLDNKINENSDENPDMYNLFNPRTFSDLQMRDLIQFRHLLPKDLLFEFYQATMPQLYMDINNVKEGMKLIAEQMNKAGACLQFNM